LEPSSFDSKDIKVYCSTLAWANIAVKLCYLRSLLIMSQPLSVELKLNVVEIIDITNEGLVDEKKKKKKS
jgi:hypothetical protein